ncbi:MAG: septum formation initiator family protein [Acidobacteria bacterium]|nr:septum formation initiator family protein [Acidobacteriota bacterium]
MKRLYLAGAVVLGLVVIVVLWSIVGQGLGQVTRARREQRALQQRKIKLERRIDQLQQKLVRLKTDPAAVEDTARKELGWVRPGEKVIYLATPTPAPTPGPLTGPRPTPILTLR